MGYLKTFVAVALFFYNVCRGPKTVSELKHPNNTLGSLRGFTIRGYEIVIYCQRKEYRIKYKRWYVPDRTESTYHVFSVVTADAPNALKKACELDVDLPALVHNWNFDNTIRQGQVEAYLDLLEKRMLKNETAT